LKKNVLANQQKKVKQKNKLIPPRINENTLLAQALDVCYNRLMRKYHVAIIITGEVGTGKSRSILLNVLDYWYKKYFNISIPEENLTADILKFANSVYTAKPYYMTGLDEAIDSFSKGASNRKIIQVFDKMYGICRERLVPSVIVLDDIFRLTTSITRHITFWIHATQRIDNKCNECNKMFAGSSVCPYCNSKNYKEGIVSYAIYSKEKLRDILRYNENREIKRIKGIGVKNNWGSAIHEYKGELVNYYNNLKTKKQQMTMQEVINEVTTAKTRKTDEVKKLQDKINTMKKAPNIST
jgi:hypothetical protein